MVDVLICNVVGKQVVIHATRDHNRRNARSAVVVREVDRRRVGENVADGVLNELRLNAAAEHRVVELNYTVAKLLQNLRVDELADTHETIKRIAATTLVLLDGLTNLTQNDRVRRQVPPYRWQGRKCAVWFEGDEVGHTPARPLAVSAICTEYTLVLPTISNCHKSDLNPAGTRTMRSSFTTVSRMTPRAPQ